MKLKKYQIYVLQLLAQDYSVLSRDYEWSSNDIPVGWADRWVLVFTLWEYNGGDQPLPDLPDDIRKIDSLRREASKGAPKNLWSNDAMRDGHPFWVNMRNLAIKALLSRRLPISAPNPSMEHWYKILPEELH